MTMAVWNVDRCYGGVEAVVAVAAPRILISTRSSRGGRGGWGWSWTTKSIDAELEALDDQQSLKERLGCSTASKCSYFRCFVSGFVRNIRAKEKDEVSEMGDKDDIRSTSGRGSCRSQLNRAPGLQQRRGAGVPPTPSGARGHVPEA